MAYEFKKLSEVEVLNEVPENANALVEVDGTIKRVPGNGLGGNTGIKTAIIKDSAYDSAISDISTFFAPEEPELTYECINMTFDEAYQTLKNGEPLVAVAMLYLNPTPPSSICCNIVLLDSAYGIPCICAYDMIMNINLYWTADGISTEEPSFGEK